MTVDSEPCSTCPYAKSTPAGVWHPSEYDNLATYDDPTWDPETGTLDRDPNLAPFACHHSQLGRDPGLLCRGWVSVHRESPAVRLAIACGRLELSDANHVPATELYGSGTEAAAAGKRPLGEPEGDAGVQAVERLTALRANRRSKHR